MLPASSLADIVSQLQAISSQLSALAQQLSSQGMGGALGGAATLAGGATTGLAPSSATSACACCGMTGAAGTSPIAGAAGGVQALGFGANAAPSIGTAPQPRPGGIAVTAESSARAIQGLALPPRSAATSLSTPRVGFAAPATAAESTGSSDRGAQIVAEARKNLGKPYVYAAAGPGAFDCSGLTLRALEAIGVKVPHKAALQSRMGAAVDKANLREGDLVFFQAPGHDDISHVGIYLGGGQFIHAPKTGDVVKISNLNDAYYQGTYRNARRFT